MYWLRFIANTIFNLQCKDDLGKMHSIRCNFFFHTLTSYYYSLEILRCNQFYKIFTYLLFLKSLRQFDGITHQQAIFIPTPNNLVMQIT